jgi:hypothetical protein
MFVLPVMMLVCVVALAACRKDTAAFGDEPVLYEITVCSDIVNGTVVPNEAQAKAGTTISLIIQPAAGYQLKADTLQYNGTAVVGLSFAMPAEDVLITAEFEEILTNETEVWEASTGLMSHTFASAFVDYDVQLAKQFVITNTGNQPLTGVTAMINGSFEVSVALSITDIAVGNTATISVSPVVGLGVGTHNGALNIDWDNSDGGISIGLSFVVNMQPVHSASVDRTSHTFSTAVEEYTSNTQQSFVITNTGNTALSGLVGEFANGYFELVAPLTQGLDVGDNTTIIIRPRSGLAVGTYTDTFAVVYAADEILSISLSFTVEVARYELHIDESEHEFDSAAEGYDVQSAKEFVVSNIGNVVISDLTATLNGYDFEISLSSNTVAVGGSVTISVQPRVGLGSGTHNDIITVRWANDDGGIVIGLSFAVDALTNAQAPEITLQPVGGTIGQGSVLNLVVVADVSDDGELTYQWFRNTTNSIIGGIAIDGATQVNFSVPTGGLGEFYYFVIITNTNEAVSGIKIASVTSEVAMVEVVATRFFGNNEFINAVNYLFHLINNSANDDVPLLTVEYDMRAFFMGVSTFYTKTNPAGFATPSGTILSNIPFGMGSTLFDNVIRDGNFEDTFIGVIEADSVVIGYYATNSNSERVEVRFDEFARITHMSVGQLIWTFTYSNDDLPIVP